MQLYIDSISVSLLLPVTTFRWIGNDNDFNRMDLISVCNHDLGFRGRAWLGIHFCYKRSRFGLLKAVINLSESILEKNIALGYFCNYIFAENITISGNIKVLLHIISTMRRGHNSWLTWVGIAACFLSSVGGSGYDSGPGYGAIPGLSWLY